MSEPALLLPGRSFVFTLRDQERYLALLKAAFPAIAFYKDPETLPLGAVPPEVPVHDTFIGVTCRTWTSIALTPGWTPVWEERERLGKRFQWVKPPPFPNGEIKPGGELSPPGARTYWEGRTIELPETVSTGEMYIRCVKDRPEHMKIARKAQRLIAKLATNRLPRFVYPEMEPFPLSEPGRVWFGHDAIDWCRQAPGRMLDFDARNSTGCRPAD